MTTISQATKVSENYSVGQNAQQTRSMEAVNSSAEAAIETISPSTTIRETNNGATGKGEDDKSQGHASNEAIKDAVEKLNKQSANTEAVFGIHDKTNRVTIKIVDKETKKVIKEFPPEKTLDLIAKAWEMAGIMVDEKR